MDYSTHEQEGFKFAKSAVDFDQSGQYAEAIFYYKEAAKALHRAAIAGSKLDSRAKAKEYMKRVKELGQYLVVQQHKHNEPRKKVLPKQESQDEQRAKLLVAQALEQDEHGNESEALKRYLQTADLCIKAMHVPDTKPDSKDHFRSLAKQALSRAEAIKSKTKQDEIEKKLAALPDVAGNKLSVAPKSTPNTAARNPNAKPSSPNSSRKPFGPVKPDQPHSSSPSQERKGHIEKTEDIQSANKGHKEPDDDACTDVNRKGRKAQINLRLEETYLKRAKRKKIIGPKGGSIELYGCKIGFPPGAVLEDTPVEISVDNNPKILPKSSLAISPIVGCEPHQFAVPVTVYVPTCYCAKIGNTIPAMIFSKNNTEETWKKINDITLGDKHIVQFEVGHFSDDVVAVSEENARAGEYRFSNEVLVNRNTGDLISVFFLDEKAQEECVRRLKSTDINYMSVLPVNFDVFGEIGNKAVVEVQCKRPTDSDVLLLPSSENQTGFQITERLLKRERKLLVNFEFLPDLDESDYEGVVKIHYTVKVVAESSGNTIHTYSSPIVFNWPYEKESSSSVEMSDIATALPDTDGHMM